MLREKSGYFGNFHIASDERAYLERQVVRDCIERAKRRERLGQVRRDELVDLLGPSEIFKTMRPEVAECRLRRHLAVHEVARDAGDQDLPAVADGQKARDAVE